MRDFRQDENGPILNSTEDAINYGLAVRGQPTRIKQLAELYKNTREEYANHMQAEQTDFDELIKIATKGQFFREAHEAATDPLPITL